MPHKEEKVFEKKPFISKLFALMLAAAVASVGEAQLMPSATSAPADLPKLGKSTDGAKVEAKNKLARHHEYFIENTGQWSTAAKFLYGSPGMNVWVTEKGWRVDHYQVQNKQRVGQVFELNFLGSSVSKLQGVGADNMVWDYISRGKSGKHHTAKGFASISAPNLYPGVDGVYVTDSGSPRFDLHVKPGADIATIKLGFKGDSGVGVNQRGDLVITTQGGPVDFGGLKAFQTINGKQIPVAASFSALGKGTVGFKVGAYDHSKELVIDPIIYGTYFGGDGGWDEVHACATDNSQGTYITGSTQESAFPANFGPYRLSIYGSQDGFVAKLQGDVYNRDYAAIFGGDGSDQGDYIQVDRQGNVWVAGLSDSEDFPGSARDVDTIVKKDVTATGGTVTFTLTNLITGVPTSFKLNYDYTAAQLIAAIKGLGYPNATISVEVDNFKVHFPYPYRVNLTVNSFDTWARLQNLPKTLNAYYLGGGKPNAASGGAFSISGTLNGASFSTGLIPYNANPATVRQALNQASGGNWTVFVDPFSTNTTPVLPADIDIIISPNSSGQLTGIQQGFLTGGTFLLAKMAYLSMKPDPAHSAPTGGKFTTRITNPLTNTFADFPFTWGGANPGPQLPVGPAAGPGFQFDLLGIQTAAALRYTLVLPLGSSTPQNGPLDVLIALEGTSDSVPLQAPGVTFLPTLTIGPWTLTPTPNYQTSTSTGTDYKYGFLMRWKASTTTILNPEVGAEKVFTWSAVGTNVTINGFNIYKSSDTPSNEPIPFYIAGTNCVQDYPLAYVNSGFMRPPGTPTPVDYQYKDMSIQKTGTIPGFRPNVSYSYRLRATFNPSTNRFQVLTSSGYDGDSSVAPVITRGSTVDKEGHQVIGGTVFYAANFDTRNPGTPFRTTANSYDADGFDGRLLRQTDMFLRRYDSAGVLTSSCLIGGNGFDTAGGYEVPKEAVLVPNPLNATTQIPWNGSYGRGETITGSCVAVDSLNNAYITGVARSFDFPRTRNVYGEVFATYPVVSVTKLSPDFSQLLYSTHLRTVASVAWNEGEIFPAGIGVGPGGEVFISGNIHPANVGFTWIPATDTWANQTTSIDPSSIPTTPDALRPNYVSQPIPDIPTQDGFLMVLNSTATGLIYSSYIGADLDDTIYQPYIDKFGDCWISGWTSSRRWDRYYRQHPNPTLGTPEDHDVLSDMGQIFGGGQSQITDLAFKRDLDGALQNEYNILYGYDDYFHGSRAQTTVFPPTDGYPGWYTESRDGFLQRYRFNLPVLTGVSFDRPTLAGGLGNVSNGFVNLSAPAPAPGINVTLTMKNNTAASFSNVGPTYQSVLTIPTGSTSASFPVYTNTVASLQSVDISASFEGDLKVGRLVVAPWFASLAVTPNSTVGGDTVQGRVRLFENAPAGGVPVSIVSSDTNLATVPLTVTVPAGQPEAAFPVKTFGVKVSSIVQISASFAGYGGQQQLTLTPANLFTLTFDPTVVDGKTVAVGTVKLDGNAGTKFSVVPVGLPAGYSISPNPIVFDPADTTKDPSVRTFTLTTPFLLNDTNLNVTLTRTDNRAQTVVGSVTVVADPVTTIAVNTNPVAGGDPTSVTVGLTSPAAKGGALVHVTSSSASALLTSAIGGIKATSVYGLIKEGDTTVTIPVTTRIVYSDTLVNFTADRGTAQTGVPNGVVKTTATPLTIKGIGVTLALNPTSVAGGSPSQGTVTLSHSAPVGGLSVLLKSSNAAIAKLPSAVTIPAGASTASFNINTIQPLNGKTTNTTISATLGTKVGTAVLTVRAPQPAGITFNPSSVTGGNVTVGTINLDVAAPATGAVVTLTSSNAAIAKIPASVTVPAGKSSVNFNVPTTVITGSASTTVTATFNGGTVSTTLTVVSANIATVSLSPTSVTGGTNSTCTVTLNTAAPAGGAVITLTVSNGTIASIPASLTIPAGQISGQVTITTQPVSRPLSTTVTAKYKSSQGSAALLITP